MLPITDFSIPALRETFAEMGEPSFRARQVMQWVYQKRIHDFSTMANTPKDFRIAMTERFSVGTLTACRVLESAGGDAVKFAFESGDSPYCFESVLLFDAKRRTACVSSQLGCDLGCVFCATAKLGFIRNLTQHEILGQLIAINDYLGARQDKLITNIVFMGMGEALSNFSRFASAVAIITLKDTFNLAKHRITVSTAGVVPSIRRLRESGLGVGLAISLNTFSDTKRDLLMPINRHYPINAVVAAADEYARSIGEPITFEYVVIKGENDTNEAVSALRRLLKGVSCKINLIPLNPGGDSMLPPEGQAHIDDFSDRLFAAGLMVTVRKSRGRDIRGACGQLSGINNESEARDE
jgi:23S rRNA (adenine2503-C2)-methyltransferase